jgi:hypothetical protein
MRLLLIIIGFTQKAQTQGFAYLSSPKFEPSPYMDPKLIDVPITHSLGPHHTLENPIHEPTPLIDPPHISIPDPVNFVSSHKRKSLSPNLSSRNKKPKTPSKGSILNPSSSRKISQDEPSSLYSLQVQNFSMAEEAGITMPPPLRLHEGIGLELSRYLQYLNSSRL